MQTGKRIQERIVLCLLLLLTGFALHAQTNSEIILKNKIVKAANRIGIPAAYLQDAIITKTYIDKSSGIQYVYLQQTCKGIPVYNSMKTLAFKGDTLLYSSGSFISKTERLPAGAKPVIEAAEAIKKAAQHLHLPIGKSAVSFIRKETGNNREKFFFTAGNLAKRDIEVQLYWAADSLKQLHLAWNVNIDVANSPDWWNVRIDAKNGEVVSQDNWTTYEQFYNENSKSRSAIYQSAQAIEDAAPPNDATGASYLVIPFPAENRNVKSLAAVANPWEMAGANNDAATYGWHYNGTTTYNITRGNNVYAYDDSASKNIPGSTATSLSPLPGLSFSFVPDFAQTTSLSINKSAAITNLFYWNNLMHDVIYQYGFTEAAGNFQANNLNRGGTGSDPVLAEAHDGSGLNNANFASPDDGSSGRMQMYLWDAITPSYLTIKTPAEITGSYVNTESNVSTVNKLKNIGPVTDTVALYTGDTLACAVELPANLSGKIALIYRGVCSFTDKIRNAQNAGAIAVIVVNSQGADLITMFGTNDSITIPAVLISYEDGIKIDQSVKAGNTVTATLSAPLLDGDFDNGIICHEYGHGITHRLTGGNASCMSNKERPDEGWSDYYGLMMTQDWANSRIADSAKSRSFGTYVFGQAQAGSGIRTFPYSTSMTIDPHTYADISKNDGEVHYIGETWCSALWDMTWGIIKQEAGINPNIYDASGSGGNVIAMKLVVEGEKLQPCSPGFLDSRDAILAADSILYGGRHKCTIWNAFARRGMGISAVQGSSDKTNDQTAAFDVPVLRLHSETLPAINDQLTTKITVSCECQLPQSGYQLTDTLPAGFALLSSEPKATVQNNTIVFDASNFTALGQINEYSLTLIPDPNAGCAKDTVVFDDRDAHTGGGFASSKARGVADWTISTAQANKGTHSWYAADPETATDFSLISNAFTPSAFSVFSFYHRFTTEAGYDGGMVDVSTNNGVSWTSAAPYFISNGYNGIIYSFNPVDTSYGSVPLPSFTGTPKDTGFIQSLIDLSSFSGKSIKIRFRMYTDLGTTYEGWYVDDITITNGCGGLQKIGLYNNANKIIGSAKIANFNIDSNGVVLPAFGNFSVEAVNNVSALLNWTTVSEFGVSNFVIERSTDSIAFTTLGMVAVQSVGSSYAFTDNNPAVGMNYYRIRMIDKNGNTLVTSPARSVSFTRNTGGVTVVPNPAVSLATVLINTSFQAKEIAVFDMQGKRLLQAALNSGTTSYPIHTSGLSAGVYIVKVVSVTGEIRNIKLLVKR